MVSIDLLEQQMVRQVRIEKWEAGKRVELQELTQHRTLYQPNEAWGLLQAAGFRQISVRGDDTDGPVTQETKEWVFTALK